MLATPWIRITKSDFADLQKLRRRLRSDWPIVFSCNASGDVWPFVTLGFTRVRDRNYLTADDSQFLIRIVGRYLDERPAGGRIFINQDGVYVKPADVPIPVLSFRRYGW